MEHTDADTAPEKARDEIASKHGAEVAESVMRILDGLGSDYEIMTLAVEIHRLLKEIAPYSFRDLDDMALTAKSVLP